LMYLRAPGDAGMTSRNPNYSGAPDAVQDYYLNNGQRDEYPLAWAIPLEDVKRALKEFADHKQRPAWVQWHDDAL